MLAFSVLFCEAKKGPMPILGLGAAVKLRGLTANQHGEVIFLSAFLERGVQRGETITRQKNTANKH